MSSDGGIVGYSKVTNGLSDVVHEPGAPAAAERADSVVFVRSSYVVCVQSELILLSSGGSNK